MKFAEAQVVMSADLVQGARERLNHHDGVLWRQELEFDMVAALHFLADNGEVVELDEGTANWRFQWANLDRIYETNPHPLKGGGEIDRGIVVGIDHKTPEEIVAEQEAISDDNEERHGPSTLSPEELEKRHAPEIEKDQALLEKAREDDREYQFMEAKEAELERARADAASPDLQAQTLARMTDDMERTRAEAEAAGNPIPEPNPAGDIHQKEDADPNAEPATAPLEMGQKEYESLKGQDPREVARRQQEEKEAEVERLSKEEEKAAKKGQNSTEATDDQGETEEEKPKRSKKNN